MTKKRYFGESVSVEDETFLKEINEDIKLKNPEYIFQKPPSKISVKWDLEDWMHWIDWCHEPDKNHYKRGE